MRQLKIDSRSREDIIKQIALMAPHYVPEWRFNPEDADPGTALSLIWADMFADTLQKYNKIPEQNKTAFFNTLGANLKPAVGASGFLSFELQAQDDVGGYIKKDTEVFANMPEEDPVYFAVGNGIYVTPAEIQDIICTMPAHDKLIHSWDGADESRVALFNRNGIDLQTHYFYIGQDEVFDVGNEGCVYIQFTAQDIVLSNKLLTSDDIVTWEYLSSDGYIPFSGVSSTPNGIALQFDSSAPPISKEWLFEEEQALRFIRLTLLKPEKFENLVFRRINVHSQNYGLVPSVVYTNDLEQTGFGFYPFGEQFNIYQDLYIACDEALGKPGAEIELTFDLKFIEINIGEKWEKDINWKPIMRKRDFDKEAEYRIRLKRTSWEYFNGKGWATLPITGVRHEELFYSNESGGASVRCQLSFICPDDISDVLVNAFEKKYIRIRALEVENIYRTNGYYVSPWIENMGFKYHYPNKDVLPMALITHSNGEITRYSPKAQKAVGHILFYDKKHTDTAAYFRYDIPPVGSPVKLLLCIDNEYENELPRLTWEYYTKTGWRKLTVYDETRNFMKSGIITFIGHGDFESLALFGFEGYWIRCVDIKAAYESAEQCIFPVIDRIYHNTVRISNRRLREEEIFSVEDNEAGKKCVLLNGMVGQVKCYVLEKPALNDEEVQRLVMLGQAEVQQDENGEITGIWMLWEEVESFVFSSVDSRHYTVDRNIGVVTFGDGVYGKLPDRVPNGHSIRIIYYTNDGSRSDLEAYRIERFAQTNHFISRMYNPLPTVGGYDQEDVRAAMKRSARGLSHLSRAVTPYDYEALAYEASLNVRKCKCFPNTNKKEEYEKGAVTLIILQKDYEFGGDYFMEMKKQIKDFIIERNALPLTLEKKFEVAQPWFIRMNVKIYCSTDSMDNTFYVQQKIIDRVNAFLDPVKGNFDGSGWEIGHIPNVTQITNYIKNIAHVKVIEKAVITYGAWLEKGYSEVDLDHVERYKFILPENGKHEVFVSVVQ